MWVLSRTANILHECKVVYDEYFYLHRHKTGEYSVPDGCWFFTFMLVLEWARVRDGWTFFMQHFYLHHFMRSHFGFIARYFARRYVDNRIVWMESKLVDPLFLWSKWIYRWYNISKVFRHKRHFQNDMQWGFLSLSQSFSSFFSLWLFTCFACLFLWTKNAGVRKKKEAVVIVVAVVVH